MQEIYVAKGRLKKLDNFNYTVLQLDVIKELANIGGGNAASSISKLIGKPVSMTVPKIEILNYEGVFNQVMAEDILVNSVLSKMVGAAEGVFLFIVTDEVAENLINMMLPTGIEANEEIRQSALNELVNILVTSFINAISMMVRLDLSSSVPIYVKDMFGAIFSSVYIDSEQFDDNIMIIKNEFLYQGDRLESSLYFVPKPGVLQRLFELLGIGDEQ
jgi:chemotaxis protein CheC